ncbi:MAG TPA: 6-carboxytetrahydropterin synthase [Bryobacteraceae bacterium]|nr:6-carboxytetrahydropterin synthase [Bryobacteraceae bacterium]
MTRLTRVYRFSASHRLHSRHLSDAENAEIFGKCNNPFGHGHDYVLSVTISGPIDKQTGLLISVKDLDALVTEKVLDLFAYRNINLEVSQFSELVPTTENIVRVIAGILKQHWDDYFAGGTAQLSRVQVQETDRNGFEVLLAARPDRENIEIEGLLVNA